MSNNEVNIGDLLSLVYKEKLWILFFLFFFLISSALYSSSLPNIYKSSVLMIGVDENQSNIKNASSSYAGLASLAGVSLPQESDNISIAIGILKSRNFVTNFINRKDILINLIAVEGWDLESNKLIIDESVFDVQSNQWVRNVSLPRLSKPSDQEAYKHWIEKTFSIEQDDKSRFVVLNIAHYSPYVAQEWASWLVEDINNYMRNTDIAEAETSIKYLNGVVLETESAELKSLLYKIIESKVQKIMLAKSRQEYIFKIIDPAIAPEDKISPKRFLITIMGGLFGLILGILYVIIRWNTTMNSSTVKSSN
jgi:uncharacterized protein involved in exopolysaccharide biosynthesis